MVIVSDITTRIKQPREKRSKASFISTEQVYGEPRALFTDQSILRSCTQERRNRVFRSAFFAGNPETAEKCIFSISPCIIFDLSVNKGKSLKGFLQEPTQLLVGMEVENRTGYRQVRVVLN